MNEGFAPARLIHAGSRRKSALVSPSRAGGAAVGSRGMVASLLPTVGHNVKRWPRDRIVLTLLYQFLPQFCGDPVTARRKIRSLMILRHLIKNDRGVTA